MQHFVTTDAVPEWVELAEPVWLSVLASQLA